MKLQTFVDLSGKYAKNLFRLLKQFKNATKTAFLKCIAMKTTWRVFVLLWVYLKILEKIT